MKPAFLSHNGLSFGEALAPAHEPYSQVVGNERMLENRFMGARRDQSSGRSLPALSPRRCKQGWCNVRGEGLRVRGHPDLMQPWVSSNRQTPTGNPELC